MEFKTNSSFECIYLGKLKKMLSEYWEFNGRLNSKIWILKFMVKTKHNIVGDFEWNLGRTHLGNVNMNMLSAYWDFKWIFKMVCPHFIIANLGRKLNIVSYWILNSEKFEGIQNEFVPEMYLPWKIEKKCGANIDISVEMWIF